MTAEDIQGQSQTITSNTIHPYFARVAAGAILATASVTSSPVLASEGHEYAGDIAGGAWVDAQHLKPGDELLGEGGQWQTVIDVEVKAEPLQAFNLSVDEYATYFVAGDASAEAVWVHNTCYVGRPDGFVDTGTTTPFGHTIIEGPDGRQVYQGHPPNDNNWYDIDGSPPTPISSVTVSGRNARQRGDSYEIEIRNSYGGAPASDVRFTDSNGVNRRADHVVQLDGSRVAIEAKYTDNWDNSIYNPDSPIGNASFARDTQQGQIDQMLAYAENFPETVYHTNSPELAAYNAQRLAERGITNIRFVITTATR